MKATDQSEWRLPLARRVAGPYYQDPGVSAVGVTGSVARGWADRYSDIELLVLWSDAPSEWQRETVARRAGAGHLRLYPQDSLGTDEWSEDFLVHGVKFDVLHLTIQTLDQLIHDVVGCYDTSLAKQHVLSSLQYVIALAGADILGERRMAIARYPDGLAEAMVQEYLRFGPQSWVEMLADRGEIVGLHDIYVHASRTIVTLLLALNRVYHPGFKWLDRTIEDLSLQPSHLTPRLHELFQGEPREGVRELRKLIGETFSLVETTMPGIDTRPARERFEQTRSVWDSAPASLFEGT